MSHYSLRDYQIECIEKIKETFKNNDKQLIQMPTGSGKTFIFINYLKQNSKSSLIICPSHELREQIIYWSKFFGLSPISDKIDPKKHGINHYVITAASLNYDVNSDFLLKKGFDHIIIDEAHRAQAATYKKFLSKIEFDYKLLGCTATPERLDNKSLLEIFDKISYEKNIVDMINDGHLCDLKAFRIKTNCKILSKHSDFIPVELKYLDNETRNEMIVKTYEDNCKDLKTIIFCLSIEHSKKISKILCDKGYKAASIYGNMSYPERSKILRKYKDGEIQVLCNCQLLTEGFDEPSIQSIIIARPTKSKSLYCQMIGRGVRNFEGKDFCYLYELTDNCHNICSFNTAAGKENDFSFEYPNGISLTKLQLEVNKLMIEDIILDKQDLNIFSSEYDSNCKNFNKTFYDMPATKSQLEKLKEISLLPKDWDINFLEASFILWKEKMIKNYFGEKI
jgi:superfamily II DNA or RNA helicase